MKKDYLICGDLFIATAFATFVLGIVFKLLRIGDIALGITPQALLKTSFWCVLFSMALSLIDMASKNRQ